MAMNEFSLSDLAAVTGNRNNDGLGGGDGALWLLILIVLFGGFGNRGYGGYGGAGNVGGNELYPWLNNAENVNSGFRDQMLQTNVQGIQQSINALSTQLCNCCGDMQMALANGFAGVEQGANARQMANMQQAFQQQLATQQGFSGVQGQLAQQTATILAENCADRAALNEGVRDIIANNTAQTQTIIDKLCQLELDGVKNQLAQAQRENVGLQNQLNMANLAASQQAQNALIMQGFANEVDALYNRLNTCPVPTTPVYGRTPIFTCQNNGCGCNCGGM